MGIQIFGTNKCFDTKKAQRFFKERGVSFQFIDLLDKGMSKGEMKSVIASAGGIDCIINENAKDKDTLSLIKYLTDDAKLDKLLENQHIIKTPIVRSGLKAAVGNAPEKWKELAK